jgi:DNA-binding NarL/FixJ family response regulator
MSPTPLRILIVDDHATVRSGLTALLAKQPDMEVVGEAASGEEALEVVGRARPDLVIMDVSMPGMNGIDTTAQLVGSHPGLRVVMLTSFGAREIFKAALRNGAVGYVLKDAPPSELLSTLRYMAGLSSLAIRRGAPVTGSRQVTGSHPFPTRP